MTSKKLRILDETPSQIPSNKLPSNADIIKALFFEKQNANISKEASIKIVSNQVYELWHRAMIPIVSKQRLQEKLSDYYEEYSKLSKDKADRKSYDIRANNFKVIMQLIYSSFNSKKK